MVHTGMLHSPRLTRAYLARAMFNLSALSRGLELRGTATYSAAIPQLPLPTVGVYSVCG